MENFEKHIIVDQDDLDELGHVNNVRYVQWIQDISKEHWVSRVPLDIRQAVMWVVLNHNITYKAPALLGDEVRISTYIEATRGAKSIRIVEMHHAITNRLLLRSRTEWCLLDAQKLKPTRVGDEILQLF